MPEAELPPGYKPKGPLPLFLQDLLEGTAGWSDEERFKYVRLINHLWKTGGKIADDLTVIAEESGLNRARNWREKAEKLRYKLVSHPTEKGFLTHRRVYADLLKAADISQKRAAAGKTGGSNSLPPAEAIAPLARAVLSPLKKDLSTPLRSVDRSKESPDDPFAEDEPEPQKRARRLSANWQPSEQDVAFATEKGFSHEQITEQAERFRNHWTAEGGSRGAKRDWAATWRNWLYRAAEFNGTATSTGSPGSANAAGKRPSANSVTQAALRAAARGPNR